MGARDFDAGYERGLAAAELLLKEAAALMRRQAEVAVQVAPAAHASVRRDWDHTIAGVEQALYVVRMRSVIRSGPNEGPRVDLPTPAALEKFEERARGYDDWAVLKLDALIKQIDWDDGWKGPPVTYLRLVANLPPDVGSPARWMAARTVEQWCKSGQLLTVGFAPRRV